MTKVTFASHPYLLGFEQLDRLVERTAKSGNDGYPPYNIEQRSDAAYRITLAVAGFAEDDLAITLENNQLRSAAARPTRRTAGSSCTAASPPGSSSAALCWRTASRCREPRSRTGSCTSISPGPSPRRSCAIRSTRSTARKPEGGST